MKPFSCFEKIPKFLAVAKDLPSYMVRYMNLVRGELVMVAPQAEQPKEKQYVKVFAKRGGKWKYYILSWKHLDFLKK